MINPAYFSTFLLLGDFNVDFCNPQHFMFSHLNNILCSFSLTQVVPSFTHVSPSGSKSLIDLALLADKSHLQSCSTIPPLSSSDHLGVSLTVKWKSRLETTRTNPRRIWMYKNADFSKACDLIQQTDWECLLSDDVDRSTKLWTKRFLDIMEECVPQRVLQNRKRNLPWLTKNIIRHMRKRNSLFQGAKRTADPARFNKYKRMRNKVTAMLRSAKQKYFDSLSTAGNKKFWKTVKLLNKQQVSIPTLQEDGVSAVTDEEKSNMLNEYFSKCWNHSEPPLSDSFVNDPVEQDDSTVDLLCSTDEIIHLIQGLDVTKANGPDDISARMLKATASSIAPSLTKLFNFSISRGHFPTPWKVLV